MIPNAGFNEKEFIYLSNQEGLLLGQAKNYTEIVIKNGDLDRVLDQAITHAIEQNIKIGASRKELLILDSYINKQLQYLKRNIISEVQKKAIENDYIDIEQFDTFKVQIEENIENKLTEIARKQLNKRGYKKGKVRLFSTEYYLLPPNYMDENVYVWASEELQSKLLRLNLFLSLMIVIQMLLGMGLYMFADLSIISRIFRLVGLGCLVISLGFLIYTMFSKKDQLKCNCLKY